MYNRDFFAIRTSVKNGQTRPICILTSGHLSPESLDSLRLELQTAQEQTCVELPANHLRWVAIDSGLEPSLREQATARFRQWGMDFRCVDVDGNQNGTGSTKGMYRAREKVLHYARKEIGPEWVLCWLDADLHFSTLAGTKHGTSVRPCFWLHSVWHYHLQNPDVDLATGDVSGDPPLPASSCLKANLRDLLAHDKAERGEACAGPERWQYKDPAYDLSETVPPPPLPFPLHTEGRWEWDPCKLAQTLLWRGTLARPLVYNCVVAQQPHRPKWVRGGVTVIFNRKVMHQDYMDMAFDGGYNLRRGDSFWMLKVGHDHKVGHFPYPLLHLRENFEGGEEALITRFVKRGVSDYLGAATLKATAEYQAEHLKWGGDFRTLLRQNLRERRERILLSMRECKEMATSLTHYEGMATVTQAIDRFCEALQAIRAGPFVNQFHQRANRYLTIRRKIMNETMTKQETHIQSCYELADTWVRNRPVYDNPEGLTAVWQDIQTRMEGMGFTVEIIGNPEASHRPLLICRRQAGPDCRTIGFVGHYDVEPVKPWEWDSNPWEIDHRNGRWYGRGLGDNLLPLAQRLLVLQDCFLDLNVLYILQGEEEMGGEFAHRICPNLDFKEVDLWIEETGYFYKDGAQRILCKNSTPLLERVIRRALLPALAEHGRAWKRRERMLNKAVGGKACPFQSNLIGETAYLGIGPNDDLCAIHAPNESMNPGLLPLCEQQLRAVSEELSSMKAKARARDMANQTAVFEEYTARVGLCRPRAHGLPELRHVTATLMANCYYNNIPMLIGNQGRAPVWKEIAADMLSGGGGPCTVANIFLREFLCHLGFDCAFIPCYKVKDGQKELMHIGLLVRIGWENYFLDFGNGYPYFSPASFDAPNIYSHGGLHYRLQYRGGARYALQHKFGKGSRIGNTRNFEDDFLIELKPVPLRYFKDMMHRHYTDSSFSHFLRSLRLIKFPDGGVFALRVNLKAGKPYCVIVYSESNRFCAEPIAPEGFSEVVKQHFPQQAEAAVRAFDHLITIGGNHHD